MRFGLEHCSGNADCDARLCDIRKMQNAPPDMAGRFLVSCGAPDQSIIGSSLSNEAFASP